MVLHVLSVSLLLLTCFAESAIAQTASEPDKTTGNSAMAIYITPFYNSEGPQVSVGEYSRKLADANATSILPLAAELQKKKDKLRAEVMYVVAIRLFDLGHKDEAVYWFYTAQYHVRVLHSIVDLEKNGRIGDATFELLQAHISFFELAGPYINKHAFGALEKLEKTLTTVAKEWEALPEFAKIYPNVKFIKADAWAEQNKEISAGLTKLIDRIKTEGDSIKEQLKSGGVDPPLIQRIKAHDAAGAEQLIREGANVNAKGKDSETPLGAAIEAGERHVFLALLKHGADPNAHNGYGATAVHTAAEQDDVFWLTKVLANGGKVDALNTGNRFYPKQTPIYYAIDKRAKEAVRLLINSTANLNHTDDRGRNPVYWAFAHGMYPEVKLMIEKGADPKLWARGRWSILNDDEWVRPVRIPGLEPESTGFNDLHDFLTDKGFLPPRPNRAEKAAQEAK